MPNNEMKDNDDFAMYNGEKFDLSVIYGNPYYTASFLQLNTN